MSHPTDMLIKKAGSHVHDFEIGEVTPEKHATETIDGSNLDGTRADTEGTTRAV